MPHDIKHFFSESLEASAVAEELAKEAFAAAHPHERLARAKLRADEQERFVVLVQYGSIATPSYACYTITKATREITELANPSAYLPRR